MEKAQMTDRSPVDHYPFNNTHRSSTLQSMGIAKDQDTKVKHPLLAFARRSNKACGAVDRAAIDPCLCILDSQTYIKQSHRFDAWCVTWAVLWFRSGEADVAVRHTVCGRSSSLCAKRCCRSPAEQVSAKHYRLQLVTTVCLQPETLSGAP